MADEVDGTFEDVEVDHERDGECTMGSAMSARDDGEVDVVVDMVFRCVKKPWSNKQLVYNVVCRKLHRYLELLLQRVRVPIDVIFVHVWMRTLVRSLDSHTGIVPGGYERCRAGHS